MFEHADNTVYFRTWRRGHCHYKRKRQPITVAFFVFSYFFNCSTAQRTKSAFDIPDAASAAVTLSYSSALRLTANCLCLSLTFSAYLLSAAFCASLLATVTSPYVASLSATNSFSASKVGQSDFAMLNDTPTVTESSFCACPHYIKEHMGSQQSRAKKLWH